MEGRFRIGGIDAIRNACLVIIKNGILEIDIVAQCDLVLGYITDNPIEGIGCKLFSLGCTGLRRGEVIAIKECIINTDSIAISHIMMHHNTNRFIFITNKVNSNRSICFIIISRHDICVILLAGYPAFANFLLNVEVKLIAISAISI